MDTTKIEGIRNLAKGKLKEKFALLTDNDQLLDESINEIRLGRLQVNLSKTKEELTKSQTPASYTWFSDWGIYGGEGVRMEINRLEAKNKKYNPIKLTDLMF